MQTEQTEEDEDVDEDVDGDMTIINYCDHWDGGLGWMHKNERIE